MVYIVELYSILFYYELRSWNFFDIIAFVAVVEFFFFFLWAVFLKELRNYKQKLFLFLPQK